jgi:Carbohydrate binding domain (family 11)
MATRKLGLWTFLAVLGASGCSASSDKSANTDDVTGSAGTDAVGIGGSGSGNTMSGSSGSTNIGGSTGTAGGFSGTGGAPGAGGTADVGAGGTATGVGGTLSMGTCANPAMPVGASGPACKMTVVPTAPMIDDMELIHDAQDGQPHGNTDNNIPGHWFVSNDGTNGTWIAPANKWMGYYNVKLDPARDTSQQAMFFGGQGFTAWGVALGVGVAACVDASPYMGVSFWAKSTTASALPVKFDVGTYDVVVSTNGGGCTGACTGKYETAVSIPVEWKQIQIPFCAFAPIGTTIPLAKNKIVNLTFLIAGNVTYQFYIDDISFY